MSNLDLKDKITGPIVSVVIPTYQRESSINRAIVSVLAQRGIGKTALELIVIDDGSTDRTEAVINAIVVPAPHRIFYEKIKHIGQPGLVRNHALARSSGEYIGYCDSDDIWLPHHLATCLRQFELHPDCVMVETWWSFQRREKTFNRWKIEYHPAFTDSRTTTTNSRLHRRDSLIQAGLFGSLKWGEDIDLWTRIGFVGPIRRVKIPTTAHAYTRGGDNITFEFCPDVAQAYGAASRLAAAPARSATSTGVHFNDSGVWQNHLTRTIAEQNVELDKFRSYVDELTVWRDHLSETVARQTEEINERRFAMEALLQNLTAASEGQEALRSELIVAQTTVELLQQKLNAIFHSTSWRITHPLRVAIGGLWRHRFVYGVSRALREPRWGIRRLGARVVPSRIKQNPTLRRIANRLL